MAGLWRTRKPPLREVGQEPDYRFTLANERTFLAWIRTSLGLLAAGVGVPQFVPRLSIPGGRTLLGIALVCLALLASASSYQRWERNERAIRMNEALPGSPVLRALALGVSLVSVATILLVGYGVGHRR